ncbi:MAG: protein kinase [Chloroflexota bacterium]
MTTTVMTELENYAFEHEIGRGDVTIVYRGRRKADGATVAIKVVAPQFTFDRLFVRRFQDMARQAAKLEHPNIVRTYDAGAEGDLVYVVRELIEARTLAQVIAAEGPFSPQRTLTIARQIAAALDYAHQKSVTHGDLSANRVFIDPDDHVIVADFGQTQAMSGTGLVKQGYAVGAPETIAPERVHGQGPSRQSDYYSLGVLCYQMLAGEPPFTGAPAAVLHAQAYEQPRPLHLVNPGISVSISETIGRMLAKGLELRYNTGAEFSRALAVAIEGTAPIRSPAAAAAQRREAGLDLAKPLWRRPWLWALIGGLVILVLLVLGFWAVSLWNRFRPVSIPVQVVAPSPAAQTGPTNVPGHEPPGSQAVAGGAEPATTPQVVVPTTAPSPTVIPTATPTLAPLPTPGPPVIVPGSPFTNLKLAHAITGDNQPDKVGDSFAPGSQPIYLFFDFEELKPGTQWTHRWVWGDTELGTFDEVWPEDYATSGTAWVYYSPVGGFLPGPYQVTLEIEGRVVSTATFVVQPGGL